MFLHKNNNSFAHEMEECLQSVSFNNMTLQLLYSAVAESACENRLVQGPCDCIDLLSSNPDKVVVCLLPVGESDMNMNLSIQLILIESICQEYSIPIVKVDRNEIMHVFKTGIENCLFGTTISKKASDFISDLDCCFIQSQGEELSASEKKLMNLLNDVRSDKEAFYSDFPK